MQRLLHAADNHGFQIRKSRVESKSNHTLQRQRNLERETRNWEERRII